MPGVQGVSFTDPYSAEALDIERRRRLAEALQQQGTTPLPGTEMAGGWAIPRSPLEGAAKMMQAYTGRRGQEVADEQQKALAARYQSDLAKTLSEATQAAGPHQQAQDTSQEGTGSFDMSGMAGPATRTVAGSPTDAAAILMRHPATQAIAMQQLQRALNRQQTQATLAAAGYGPATGGNPMVPGGTGSSVMAGSGTATPAGPAPGGAPPGVNPLAWALMQDGDPESVQLAKVIQEASKPTTTRFGVFGPDPNRPGFVRPIGGASPPGALNYSFDQAGNASLGTLPGQEAGVAALKSAEARGTQPFGTSMTKVPVYLPGGDQIEVNLNPVQMEQYNRTGQLPPDVAASIPGYQTPAPKPAAPSQPAAAPSPASFPKESPAERAGRAQLSRETLQNELASAQQMLADPKTTPRDLELATQNVAYLQKELANAPQSGKAVVGRGQSQEEQIRQTRQTTAGKAVDEAFAKDYVAFTTGGAQDAAKQIAQLQDVKKQLAVPGADLTGPVRGSTPDMVQKWTAAGRNAIAMRERVEEVVQRSLRAILGAQFTEKEGERLIARAYNPSLSESENAIRVGRLLTQLDQAYKSKMDAANYFQKNNTLSGWQGKLPSINDFDPEAVTVGGKITTATNDPLGLRSR
jgi:hypothetical protein